MKKKKLLLIVGLTLTGMLASCGGENPSSETTSSSSTSETTSHTTSETTSQTTSSSTSEDTSSEGGHEEENLQTTTSLRIHYARGDGDYTSWGVWAWENAPVAGDGQWLSFAESDGIYGNYVDISLNEGYYSGTTKLGFIVKQHLTTDYSTWDATGAIDVSGDRFIEIPEQSNNGLYEVYLYQGVSDVMTSLDEALKDKVVSSAFTSDTVISTQLILSTAQEKKGITKDNIELYVDDVLFTGYTFSYSSKIVRLTLNAAADISKSYKVVVKFASGDIEMTVDISMFYDTDAFKDTFTYYGDDLGAKVNSSKGSTTFKVWAPISSNVILNLYDSGTPATYASVAPSTEKTQALPSKRVQMKKGQQGVWEVTIPKNLHGKYYTYSVKNGSSTNEVVDPYAKSCGINGLRGLVVDFEKINNEVSWADVTRPTNITNATDATIYEAHVRDLTIDETSGVTETYRGKFLGLTETTSTYSDGTTTVTTGISNIKDLGVSHVQLQPIYDYSSVDETSSSGYNWGYDPLNYNCLEGSYSTNPWDGLNRVIEFKNMMRTFCEQGIQVNMDVVYNHTAGSSDTNFEKIVPGYYHRFNADGTYSNGSGCGNEMASERPMMRKFIIDSTSFWLDEYKLSGFRFDLMGLIDTTTMDTVYKNLKKIYPEVLVYGEPWTGGASTGTYTGCSDVTIQKIAGVGAFNDAFRDAARGDNNLSKGWAQAGTEIDGMWKGMYGQLANNAKDPLKTINYVSCHDNYTLYDQLSNTLAASDVAKTMTQILSLVFFNQGVPFIHGGEEIFRTKSAGTGSQIHNSYNAGDAVNRFDYSRKVTYLDEYNTIKAAIALRKEFEGFRLTTNAAIESAQSNGEVGTLYKVEINYNGQTYLVAAANGQTSVNSAGYTCVFSNNGKLGVSGSSSFGLAAHEIAVFKK